MGTQFKNIFLLTSLAAFHFTLSMLAHLASFEAATARSGPGSSPTSWEIVIDTMVMILRFPLVSFFAALTEDSVQAGFYNPLLWVLFVLNSIVFALFMYLFFLLLYRHMSKRTVILLISLIVLGLTACTVPAPSSLNEPADTSAGEVGFDLAGQGGAAIVVPVQINGEGPFNFVVDTGATLTCVDQELAKKLNLPEQSGMTGYGVGLGGQGSMQLMKVNTLQVGTARATELTVCGINLQQMKAVGLNAEGLLGLNFLKSYRMTIDFERRVLQLQNPKS